MNTPQNATFRLVCLVFALVLFAIAMVTSLFMPEPAPGRWYRALVAGGLFFWVLSTLNI